MDIRRATTGDCGALAAIAHAARASWGYTPGQLASWREALTPTARSVSAQPTFVALADGRIAGFHQLAFSQDRADLEHLWVDPCFQRRGIGRALLAHAAAEAARAGIACLYIDSDPHAEAFYRRAGARRVGLVAAPIEGDADRVRPQLVLPAVWVCDASPEDAPGIRSLMQRVIEADVTQAPRLLQETLANVNGNVDVWLAEPARCVHLKAMLDGALVGVVLVKDCWNLCSLFVASDQQGCGIGRQLVEAAVARCAGTSPKSALWLNAATGAIPFYRRLGFVARDSTRTLPPGFQAMQRPL